MPRLLLLAVLLVPLGPGSLPALIQGHWVRPAAARQLTRRARLRRAGTYMRRGQNQLSAGQFKRAMESFRRSNRYAPSARKRYLIAFCKEMSGDLESALKDYESLVRTGSRRLNASTLRARIKAVREQLRGRTAGGGEPKQPEPKQPEPKQPEPKQPEPEQPEPKEATEEQGFRTEQLVPADSRIIPAIHQDSPPAIDGKLDDPQWLGAAVVTNFMQYEPRHGKPPSFKTEMRVLYDSSGLYVALQMMDPKPEAIVKGLGRRDYPPDSDKVTLYIDPLMSKQHGYFFQTNASGVVSDGVIYNETQKDISWDGSWEVAHQINDEGWTAEFHIPLTSIGYQGKKAQDWGIYVERYVDRIRETSVWPKMPLSFNKLVSRFGTLKGLDNLARDKSLRVQPYAMMQIMAQRGWDSTRPDDVFSTKAGLDLTYSSKGAQQVTVAINPDFGQVEQDSAVVPVSPEQVFYEENRPFFLAGTGVFRTPQPTEYNINVAKRPAMQLVYTRRVGSFTGNSEEILHTRQLAGSPQSGGPGSPGILDVDPEFRLISAGKVFGQRGLFSYGVMSGLVMPLTYRERLADGSVVEREATPWTHYGVGRMKLRLGDNGTVGLTGTGVSRFDEEVDTDAYVAAGDWDIRWGKGWEWSGLASTTSTQDGWGAGGFSRVGRRQGIWNYSLELESYTADYEVNDFGYLWRNNMLQAQASVLRRTAKPLGPILSAFFYLNSVYGMPLDHLDKPYERYLEARADMIFKSMWMFNIFGRIHFPRFDDLESRGGPIMERPWRFSGFASLRTNMRKPVIYTAIGALLRGWDGFLGYMVGNFLMVRAWQRLTAMLALNYVHYTDYRNWVGSMPPSDPTGSPRWFLGDLNQDQMSSELSVTLGISRSVTFQLLSQLLVITGTYDKFYEMLPDADGVAELQDASLPYSPNYAMTFAIVSAILRWDLGDGGAAYMVYKLDGGLSRFGLPVTRFDPMREMATTFDRAQTHLLMLKFSYAFGI